MKVKNRKILITGGCGGIGSALSKLISENGGKVFSYDIKNPAVKVKGVEYFNVDVTNEKEIKRGLEKIGNLDVLINSAGIMRRGSIYEISEKDFDSLVNVNFKGSWLMIKNSEKYLRKNGMIVQISSKHALGLPTDPGIYALSKNSSASLSEMVKNSGKNYNVKIVYAGPVDTSLANYGLSEKEILKRKKDRITPEEMARKILKLMQSDKDYLGYDFKNKKYFYE